MKESAETPSVKEGDVLWTPSRERIEASRMTQFRAWLAADRGLEFASYDELWRWSIDNLDSFWMTVWDYFDVLATRPDEVVSSGEMFRAKWFRGARLNYAEHLLRHELLAGPDEICLVHSSEIRPMASITWHQLAAQVRKAATRLRDMGIRPGDRVVSYMPNVIETAIAMMATTAVGAIWSSAAPEFGAKMVIDRFSQIRPKVLFAADGYSFGGKPFDRRADIASIVTALPDIEHVVWLDYLTPGTTFDGDVPSTSFAELLAGDEVTREAFSFERVGPDHPLWILFSSGTTGVPKAITHGHVGMTLEHLKVMSLHCDLGPSKRMYFYTTTGWMMWNSVMAALITGASGVLYDGSPVHGGIDALWKMAAKSGATLFGVSPTLVKNMKAAGIVPKEMHDLSKLDTVMVGGAPSTPDTFAWLYENVGADIWVTSQSGGTDLCSGLAGGVPEKPVRAAELQGPSLGIAYEVWNDEGEPVVDEVGELVVTRPFPSAPLRFWNDEGDERYFESYFSTFSGVWRHGDLTKKTSDGGVYIYGRSDSTLNRYGVRIGSAEIYDVVDRVPGVADSLVVCIERPDGEFYMPLFVTLTGTQEISAVRAEVSRSLRTQASPRHIPDEIVAAPGIPYTISGKKMEVPVRKLLQGAAAYTVASRDSMAAPALLDWYADFARNYGNGTAA